MRGSPEALPGCNEQCGANIHPEGFVADFVLNVPRFV